MEYTTTPRSFQRNVSEDQNEATGRALAPAKQLQHRTKTAAAAGTSRVPPAILTDDVLQVCEGDPICERFSNVDSSLAGTSFQDMQDLLDSLHVAPGRPCDIEAVQLQGRSCEVWG